MLKFILCIAMMVCVSLYSAKHPKKVLNFFDNVQSKISKSFK